MAHGVANACISGKRLKAYASCTASLLLVGPALLRGFSLPSQGADVSQRFLLARHGQTTFNAEKRFQGSMDEGPVLTEKGIAQAQELGEWLQKHSVSSIFASPLLRAQQTLQVAKEVAGTVLPAEAMILNELREIDLYEWEGRTQAELAAESPETLRLWKDAAWELRLGDDRPVVRDLWDRAAIAWQLMRKAVAARGQSEPSLIVAHGTLGKALLATALGLPEQAFRHFTLKNGEVVEVMWPAEQALPSGARWRRRHPQNGAWRSVADEQAAMARNGAAAVDAP
eukprot:TRINITY_DN81929_c0_g1_i1.p1 TRINITY_DN81929_c0_g1~~TRINITY_DN81929_c0_g1_i1.p1  ORF type:complete len:296 (+),score=70.58 TRINITY_DN81929_c0_g1_i1:37-888(+)